MATGTEDQDRLVDLMPGFASELEQALRHSGDLSLATQIEHLAVTGVCGCGDDFCSSFYTGPRVDGPWGPSHRNVVPQTAAGMIVLDVVDDRIRYVEVLHRDDVRKALVGFGEGRSS